MSEAHVEVLIIGAGVSGIGMACHLKRDCPGRSFRVLERRASLGGTWDLFRYPGIRSDSDMYTFGYSFRPWRNRHHPGADHGQPRSPRHHAATLALLSGVAAIQR